MKKSLFGEVALRLSSHPENVATESLCYILREYTSASESFRSFINSSGINLPDSLTFQTQVSKAEDGTIPDLVGVDSAGVEVLLIEAKFWAGLTQNQPVAYLNRLSVTQPGCLAIVAPSSRFETLWPKLTGACEDANISLESPKDAASGFRVANAPNNQKMALITWRAILGVLKQAAEEKDDFNLKSDVNQLRGLCDQMDREAFIPLSSNDLSHEFGSRVQQFADLVDTVVKVLEEKHGASTDNLKTGGSQSAYGRYFILGGLGLFISYDPRLWARHWETPIWLSVSEIVGKEWEKSEKIREALSTVMASRQMPVVARSDPPTVPIELPLKVDHSDVVSSVTEQVLEIARICNL